MWAWRFARRIAIEVALTLALEALLEVARPLFKQVAEALGEAALFLGDQAVCFLISALEDLASLATDLARKAEEVDDSQVAAEVAQAARNIAREANELAQKLRNIFNKDDGLRKYVRTNIHQTQHFVMVPKVQSQGIMFGPTYTKPNTSVEVGARGASRVPSYMFGQTFMAEPGAQRVPSHANMRAGTFMAEPGAHGVARVSSHANMRAGTFMAEPGAHGVPRVSSHSANMGARTYMAKTGASKAESMIREVEEAARKLKAKVVNTHTIPAGQKGRKIEGAESLTCSNNRSVIIPDICQMSYV